MTGQAVYSNVLDKDELSLGLKRSRLEMLSLNHALPHTVPTPPIAFSKFLQRLLTAEGYAAPIRGFIGTLSVSEIVFAKFIYLLISLQHIVSCNCFLFAGDHIFDGNGPVGQLAFADNAYVSNPDLPGVFELLTEFVSLGVDENAKAI